nr:MAG TPA: hypothetical protein [Caudoviricetes sp.]
MIWKRLEPGKYEGSVAKAGKVPTVVTIEKVFFERPGHGKALYSTVFEEAWKWYLLDEQGNPVEFGDESTLKQAKQEAETAYKASEELLR